MSLLLALTDEPVGRLRPGSASSAVVASTIGSPCVGAFRIKGGCRPRTRTAFPRSSRCKDGSDRHQTHHNPNEYRRVLWDPDVADEDAGHNCLSYRPDHQGEKKTAQHGFLPFPPLGTKRVDPVSTYKLQEPTSLMQRRCLGARVADRDRGSGSSSDDHHIGRALAWTNASLGGPSWRAPSRESANRNTM